MVPVMRSARFIGALSSIGQSVYREGIDSIDCCDANQAFQTSKAAARRLLRSNGLLRQLLVEKRDLLDVLHREANER